MEEDSGGDMAKTTVINVSIFFSSSFKCQVLDIVLEKENFWIQIRCLIQLGKELVGEFTQFVKHG